jgi:cell division protein FtsB
LRKQLKETKKRGVEAQSLRVRESAMYQGDLQTLRQRVSQYEKHIKKLKMFVDKEETE